MYPGRIRRRKKKKKNSKKRGKNNKSPKLCLGDLIKSAMNIIHDLQ